MNRMFFKTFLITVLGLVLVIAMSGCSGSTNGKGKVQLSWLVRADPHEKVWENQMIKIFEQQNPNINIKLIDVPQDQIDQKMRTMIAGKNLPDIVAPNWANGGFMSYADQLVDLSNYVKKDPEVIDGVLPSALNLWKIKGELKALPINTLGSLLFYNKDLFKKAGLPDPPTDWEDKAWTWDKMVSYAKKLTDPSKHIYGLLDNNDPSVDAEMFGSSFISDESYKKGLLLKPNVDDPAVHKAVKAHHDLIFKYKVSPSASQLSAISQLGDPFVSGKVAMTINGGWGLWGYQNIEDFKWSVAALPYVPNRQDRMYIDIMSISKDSKHPKEAWKFMKFLYSTDSLKSYIHITQGPPANQHLMNYWLDFESKKLGISKQKLKEAHEGSIKYGIEASNHMVKDWATLIQYINQPINAYYGGNKSFKDAMYETKRLLNSWTTVKK
ncbi:sugar ABC transporter substrate-binding protein [Pullulanibacillus camelliae]|uniref:Sugar ABC transporter substrate-binding protein n=2 Tax=Pullulanibacillus camelliae TaxID=1707096 RepID=A0A8J2YBA8_9BACL|nr:sugar ABC transporter substrate-binding protein [Pullulanibacillus camelliae]